MRTVGAVTKTLTISLVMALFLLIAGCGRQYTDLQTIQVQANFSEPKTVTIETNLEAQQSNKTVPKIIVKKKGQAINEFQLGRKPVNLNIQVIQANTPFSLVKGTHYKGTLRFTAGDEYNKELPLQLYIKPWVASNYWILLALLSFASAIYLVNVIWLIRLPPASGAIRRIPFGDSKLIVPPSYILHYRRNRVTIGAGKKDDYTFSTKGGCDELQNGHFELKFLRKQDRLVCKIESQRTFYYKKGDSKQIPKYDKFRYVQDYQLEENENLNLLVEDAQRGYSLSYDPLEWDVEEQSKIILVIDKNCAFELKYQ